MQDAVVPKPSAPGSCESAGGAADGAISFKIALSVVMSKREGSWKCCMAYLIALNPATSSY